MSKTFFMVTIINLGHITHMGPIDVSGIIYLADFGLACGMFFLACGMFFFVCCMIFLGYGLFQFCKYLLSYNNGKSVAHCHCNQQEIKKEE